MTAPCPGAGSEESVRRSKKVKGSRQTEPLIPEKKSMANSVRVRSSVCETVHY